MLNNIEYDYIVTINACDYDFDDDCWRDELYLVKEVGFASYEDAVTFVKGITSEQAVEWERKERCNGLDIIIYKEQVCDGTYTMEFANVGESEWIGPNKNGDWL